MKELRLKIISWSRLNNCLYGLPLLALPICNVLSSEKWEMTLSYFCTMSFASIVEEVFFRGIMLEFLKNQNWKVQIFISSFLFSIFHFVNLFSGKSITYVIIQVLLAFVIGICFSAIVIQTGSITICVIVHILINLSAGESLCNKAGVLLCIFVYLIYGLFMCRKIALMKGNRHETIY